MDNVEMSIEEMIARVRSQDLIAEALTEQWGERCLEYCAGCYCCEAWDQYDKMKAAMPGWQDISTAPKDGTPILVADSGPYAFVVEWSSRFRGWYGADKWIWEPTHWQPLPAPPKEENPNDALG